MKNRFFSRNDGKTLGLGLLSAVCGLAAVLGLAKAQSASPSGALFPTSDSFEGSSLDPSWTVLRPEAVSISLQAGVLLLSLKDRALWAGSQQGVLVYKSLTGDFKASASLRARRNSDPSKAAVGPVNLGGLMVRDPASGAGKENYLHIVVGFAPTGIAVETKTTVNSATSYEAPSWSSSDAELRICRIGASFSLYKREIGAKTWLLAASHQRGDLPATLQVGVNIYTALPNPDLRLGVDEVRFATVSNQADCERD
jgi:hypothetical protein